MVELALDDEAMTATLVAEVPVTFVAGYGDADLLWDGERLQYVIGWDPDPYTAEISWPDGEELWRLTCPDVHELYRVSAFPTIYERDWWYTVDR